ncbi:MAG: thioredoxin domain-containing protein [Anaerolineae bacterium]|nr:thioredoxin domain-containing protein [Anaerolineae bacterium]
MTEHEDVSPDTGKPISLRDDTPHITPTLTESDTNHMLYLVITAAVFLLIGLLIATALTSGDDDSVSRSELRNAVQEAVGTEVANAQPAPVDDEGGSVNQDELQAMIDEAVGTQVQALVPTNTPIPPTPTRIPNEIAFDDDAFLGPEDAPVVIVEFSDFQCGYCGRWYQETLPQILEAYPEEVKFVYRDFPIFGEASARAAMASECAEEQGSFWEMHNSLFNLLDEPDRRELTDDTLISVAGEIDLDTDAFSECLTSERYMDEVLQDYTAAQSYGFRGTPGFVINGTVYTIGAQSFEVFDQIIQLELAQVDTIS